MCVLNIYYTNGEKCKRLETVMASSTDPRYADCLTVPSFTGVEINSDGKSSYEGDVSGIDCSAGLISS